MNNQTGIDSTGDWTAGQYAIDMGWDYYCIEATAKNGVSAADAETLTRRQAVELLAYCKAIVVNPIYP